MRKLGAKTSLMEFDELRSILFEHIANKNNEKMLYEWQKTADEIGIEKSQLEYVVSQMGKTYFYECKDGFFTKNKAFIEAKYKIRQKPSFQSVNIIGDNNTFANQSSLDKAFISPNKETNNIITPQQNKKGSLIEIASWIGGVVIAIVTVYQSCK
jgi:hypothetical protein